MALVCARCGKGIQRGHRVSHSGIRTKHVFKPNLHALWVIEDAVPAGRQGKRVRRKFCTKCLRRVKKEVSQVSKVPQAPQAR